MDRLLYIQQLSYKYWFNETLTYFIQITNNSCKFHSQQKFRLN